MNSAVGTLKQAAGTVRWSEMLDDFDILAGPMMGLNIAIIKNIAEITNIIKAAQLGNNDFIPNISLKIARTAITQHINSHIPEGVETAILAGKGKVTPNSVNI